MYRFSRSIYRELAPRVIEDEHDPTGGRNRQAVLEACEEAVRRLGADRRALGTGGHARFSSDFVRVNEIAEMVATMRKMMIERDAARP